MPDQPCCAHRRIAALGTRNKESLGIRIFGILALASGAWILYKFVVYLASKPWTDLELSWIEWLADAITDIPLWAAACFIFSGVGLLKRKPWASSILLVGTGLTVLLFEWRLIMVGPCTEEIRYVVAFATAALVIWFFNRPTIRSMHPPVKGMKIVGIVWVIALSAGLVWATINWLKKGGPKTPRLREVVYEYKGDDFYASNYVRTPFPLGYTVAVPKGSVLRKVEGGNGYTVFLTGAKEDWLIILRSESILQKMEPSAWPFGYSDVYHFSRKLFRERYGLIPMVMRSLVLRPSSYQVEEAEIGGCTCFIVKCNGMKPAADYYVFCGHDVVGEGAIIAEESGKGDLGKQRIDEMLSSIRLQDEPPKSTVEYVEEGVALFDAGDVEAAKFSFASALCLEWENAEYHYYLGRAFFETGNAKSAWEHLKQATSLDPDYPEAQELLDRVQPAER
jgi:hypothetical protein